MLKILKYFIFIIKLSSYYNVLLNYIIIKYNDNYQIIG